MSVPAVAVAGPGFEIPMSAGRWAVVSLVVPSLVWSGALVALVPICALLARLAPPASAVVLCTALVRSLEAPFASPELVQVTVPAVVAQRGEALTKVVFAGTASVTV